MRIVLQPIVFTLSIRSALQQTDGHRHRFDLIRTIGVLMWNLQTYKVREIKLATSASDKLNSMFGRWAK